MPSLLEPLFTGPNGWAGPLVLLTVALVLSDFVLRSRHASLVASAFALTAWALYCWQSYGHELALWTTAFAYVAVLGGWRLLDARRREKVAAAAPRLDQLERVPLPERLKARSEKAIDDSRVGRWFWDLEDQRLELSEAWLGIACVDRQAMGRDPQSWYERIHPIDLGKFRDALSAHLYGNAAMFECEYRMRCGDLGYRWMLTRGTAGHDADGRPVWLTGVQIDVSNLVDERRRPDDRQIDQLTGLLNRRALALLLERACKDAQGEPGAVAVLAMDIDCFKMVNDSLGMAVADDTLAAVGKRLSALCGDRAACGRQGGDEFAIVLDRVRDPEEPLELARRILAEMKRPFRIGDHNIQLRVSIGAAIHGQAGVSPEELLRNADLALQKAKSQGGRPATFDHEMRARAIRSYTLRSELSGAAERAELELYYQPIYRLSDGELVEAEALLRWRRSSGEAVSAGEFIPLAEETGIIGELGQWALRTACVARRNWLDEGHGEFRLAVNVSALELLREGFAEQVERTLGRTGAPAHLIEIELTESALIGNLEAASHALTALSSLGLRLSVDDFGTGYSSLSYVTRLPFSTIKLDRSLVTDIATEPRPRAVAQGLISLAHSLQMEVTAEGVETAGQLHWLLSHRCDRAQGYFLSKPLPGWKFSEGLRSGEIRRFSPIAENVRLSPGAP